MGHWEDETLPPLVLKEQSKSQWNDEDGDEDNVKESWDEYEEPATAPAPKPLAEKASKKVLAKAADRGKSVHAEKEEPSIDHVADKLLQQRLVAEADYKSMAELFAKKGDEKTIDSFIPKSESDFLEYAELISHKLCPFEAVMRLSMSFLKASDAKEDASSVNAIANEKLKAEKEATKKKTGSKKKQLHMDKPDNDLIVDTYDAADDYDFMRCFFCSPTSFLVWIFRLRLRPFSSKQCCCRRETQVMV